MLISRLRRKMLFVGQVHLPTTSSIFEVWDGYLKYPLQMVGTMLLCPSPWGTASVIGGRTRERVCVGVGGSG